MNISPQVVQHPCFHITDFQFLKNQGKRDFEILEEWDSKLRTGEGPKVHPHPFHLKAI